MTNPISTMMTFTVSGTFVDTVMDQERAPMMGVPALYVKVKEKSLRNYKDTSIYLSIVLCTLLIVFVHLTIKISNLKEENELLRNNYNTMQISRYQDLYEDKYVTQDIKRSMKRITKGWEG